MANYDGLDGSVVVHIKTPSGPVSCVVDLSNYIEQYQDLIVERLNNEALASKFYVDTDYRGSVKGFDRIKPSGEAAPDLAVEYILNQIADF